MDARDNSKSQIAHSVHTVTTWRFVRGSATPARCSEALPTISAPRPGLVTFVFWPHPCERD